MPDFPFACTLDPATLSWRRDTLLPGIVARAEHSELLPDGARWRFSPSPALLLALHMVVEAERRCCPFLRFQIVEQPDGEEVWFEVTGPPGTQGFLKRLPHR